MKILLTQNLSTFLLIRRASRATFPDMGRLTDSPLPTIKVKTTKQFCFYYLMYCYLNWIAIIIILYSYYTDILPY